MKILKISFFGLILIYFVACIVDYFYYQDRRTSALFSGEVQEWNRVFEGEIDTKIAIFGSSRAFIHIDPKILEENLHQSTYNLGLNGSKFKMQHYRFDEYLRHNPSPKTIVWVLDSFSFSHSDKDFQPNQYVPFMLWNLKLYRYLKDDHDFELADFFLPFYRYQDQKYWTAELKKAKSVQLNQDGMFRNKGFKSYNRTWKVDWTKLEKRMAIVDSAAFPLLDQMIERCQKENIQLVFVVAPEFYKGQDYMLNRQEIIDYYIKKSNENNIPFLDYSNHNISYQQAFFYNTTHMNADGAKLFSKQLATDLQNIIKTIK